MLYSNWVLTQNKSAFFLTALHFRYEEPRFAHLYTLNLIKTDLI